jgi:hypothetical protein
MWTLVCIKVPKFNWIIFKFKVLNWILIFIQNPFRSDESVNNKSCSKWSNPPTGFPPNFSKILRYFSWPKNPFPHYEKKEEKIQKSISSPGPPTSRSPWLICSLVHQPGSPATHQTSSAQIHRHPTLATRRTCSPLHAVWATTSSPPRLVLPA